MVLMESFPPFLINATHLESNKPVMHHVLHEWDSAKFLEELATLDGLEMQRLLQPTVRLWETRKRENATKPTLQQCIHTVLTWHLLRAEMMELSLQDDSSLGPNIPTLMILLNYDDTEATKGKMFFYGLWFIVAAESPGLVYFCLMFYSFSVLHFQSTICGLAAKFFYSSL